ncbi:MAG: hypothetical protein JSU83_16920 [Deltaproteobacteria bacterium]|nr:MAG: hypothetical protein JSU83_16920 [Deltaproteobacteria bacterium]
MIQTKPKEKLRNSFFEKGRQSRWDRRSGEDRRKIYSLDYFIKGGKERRHKNERRHKGDRRSGWIRIDKWYSIFNDSD